MRNPFEGQQPFATDPSARINVSGPEQDGPVVNQQDLAKIRGVSEQDIEDLIDSMKPFPNQEKKGFPTEGKFTVDTAFNKGQGKTYDTLKDALLSVIEEYRKDVHMWPNFYITAEDGQQINTSNLLAEYLNVHIL